MKKNFTQLNDVLNQLIQNLGIENKILENQAIQFWAEIAGNKIANNTKAERVKDGVLFIKVKNDVWRNELMFYKAKLIKKVNDRIKKQVIHDIRWI